MTIAASGDGADLDDIFVGNSEMARLMRAHDWAATPLGPPRQWPTTLKVALRLLLTSRFEMWLGWGPDIHFFYNDAYRPTLGLKHPRSLAMPTRELWPEIWDDIRGRIETVYDKGEATWDRALMLVLHRSGYPEETYHTFSYSPLLGDTGQVEGLFCAVTEETDRVISERRLGALRELAAGLATADSRAAVMQAACDALAHAARDLPFALIYLLDGTGHASRACAVGIAQDHPLAPAELREGDGHPWDLARALGSAGPYLVPLPPDADLPTGPWDTPARSALVVPIADRGGGHPAGVFVAALNPYRAVTDDFTSFIALFAGQIGAGLSTAMAHERRQAERDRLRMLFDEAPSFFCVLSGPDHVFELANASYRRLVGSRPIDGKPLKEALPEVAGQGFVELLDQVYRSGERYVGRSVEVLLSPSEGAEPVPRHVDFVYQPIRDPLGAVTGIFVEGYEVTDKVEAENALRALNAELEQRVERRTRDLADALEQLRQESSVREAAQEALRQAQKMEAVGQLTGGIAHDFNNLLQGITGALDLMTLQLQRGRTGELESLIGRAMNSARRAAGMTHRLLAFSRRQPLDPKPLKVNQLVAPMEDLLRRTMGERIRIEMVLAGGLWTALCDANQLESAILNLCINARDAMPDGGLLTVETANAHLDEAYASHSDATPGQYICISVSDTGEGMTPDVLAKAVDPFFTTKPIGQGTGLGLSMVYGFAKQSNGHFKLYSQPGQGTTARIYLPRHFGEAGSPEPAPQLRAEGTGSGQVILVVEDEPVVRSLMVDTLLGLGYRTIEAPDGGQALAVVMSDAHIDLLVTDVGLPVLNGRQLYDAAVERRPGLKVLFMTGYAENASLSGGMLEPGMELITKPFPMEKVVSTIARMLRKEGS
jgi:signal transduction histidine kinase/ActR/RegA family two-component response regulator